MNTNHHTPNNSLANIYTTADPEVIRFEETREKYIWVHPDEIIFVRSADHYVKSLINCGKQKKWMIRHCTLKELFVALTPGNFIRLNKFYLINCSHFSHINENEKILYLNDDFAIPVPHGISRYVLDLLKMATRKMQIPK